MKRFAALCSLLVSISMMSGVVVTTTACDPGTGGSGGSGGSGGGSGGGGGVLDKPHTTTGSTWTVLVYMVADNDLEPFAVQDLNEMMTVGSRQGFNLVVQVDRAPGYSNDAVGGLGNFEGTKRVIVRNGTLEQVADLGEQDMANPTTLSSFIQWGLTSYPADRTMLVFWDHGGGWTGFGVDETTGQGKLLNLPQIEQGVKAGLAAVSGSKPFQIIGFDACLMATYEVALTLAPHAEYLLASEEVEPGHGWDWSSMSTAATATSVDPVTFAKSIIAGFKNQATVEKTVDNITLSLIDLYKMGTMSTAVGQLITAFGTGSAQLTTAFARAQEQAQKYGDNPDPQRATNMVDLHHLSGISGNNANNSALSAAVTAVQNAIGQVVVDNAFGAARSNSKGMAVYFPARQAYYQSGYDLVTAASAWKGLLNAYFGSAGGSATGRPQFTDPNKVGTMGYDAQGNLAIQGTLAAGSAASIARATMVYGVYYNGTYIELGDTPAAFNDSMVQGAWDLSALTLTQGANSAYAYSSISVVGTRYALNILFGYVESAGATPLTCVRQIVFSADTAGNVTISSDAYYVAENGTYGELIPAAGSSLMPLLKTIDPSTGAEALVNGATAPFYASTGASGQQEFQYVLEYAPLQTGTVVFEVLTIENAAGQGDAVANTGTL
jgi:hypothetical protein